MPGVWRGSNVKCAFILMATLIHFTPIPAHVTIFSFENSYFAYYFSKCPVVCYYKLLSHILFKKYYSSCVDLREKCP